MLCSYNSFIYFYKAKKFHFNYVHSVLYNNNNKNLFFSLREGVARHDNTNPQGTTRLKYNKHKIII